MRIIFSRRHHKRLGSNGSLITSKSHLSVLIHSGCLSPLSLDDQGGEARVNGSDGLVMRHYSYQKLPQQLLKLSVLKLDGSVFDFNICRNATVRELKQAIEEVFISSAKEGDCQSSWFHVWGHFCLSYQAQKLINDKNVIRNLGIKDGDQLQFVRHMSMNYSNSKRRLRLTSGNDAQEEIEQKSELHQNSENNKDKNRKKLLQSAGEEEEEVPAIAEFKLAQLLRGWLSCSKSRGGSRKGGLPTQSGRPSRFRSRKMKEN